MTELKKNESEGRNLPFDESGSIRINEHDMPLPYSTSGLAQRLVETHFPWPDWDSKTLGPAPVIAVSDQPDKAYLEQLNKVLARISEISHIESAEKFRQNLQLLSGVPINLAPGFGLPKTEDNVMQHEPLMKFDPNAWARYPAVEPPPLPHPIQDAMPRKDYAIAPPEQLLISELGRYLKLHEAYQQSVQYKQTGEASHVADAGRLMALGHSPRYAIDHAENPAMHSAFPEYKPRDPVQAEKIQPLFAGKEGYPEVPASERHELDFALKVHGSNSLDHDKSITREAPAREGASNQEKMHHLRSEAFRSGYPEDVVKLFPELGEAYLVFATLKKGVEQSGIQPADQAAALHQVRENLASSIAAGKIPNLMAAETTHEAQQGAASL